jgi:hypothetical protein
MKEEEEEGGRDRRRGLGRNKWRKTKEEEE